MADSTAKDLGIDIRLSAEQPVMVAGDRDELLRVAENLIENVINMALGSIWTPGVVDVAVSTTEKEGLDRATTDTASRRSTCRD